MAKLIVAPTLAEQMLGLQTVSGTCENARYSQAGRYASSPELSRRPSW